MENCPVTAPIVEQGAYYVKFAALILRWQFSHKREII